MIVEHGILSPAYSEAASAEAALASARAGQGVAWIGAVDPSVDELTRLAQALGVSDEVLAEVTDLGEADRVLRARASGFDGVGHVVLRGAALTPSGVTVLEGEIEVIATPTAVVVVTRDLGTANQPPAIRNSIASALAAMPAPTAGVVVRLLVAQVLDGYDDVLDEIELEFAAIADELFGKDRARALPHIYGLAGPVHGAMVAIHPFAHGLDRVLRELGESSDLDEERDRRAKAEYLGARIARLDGFLASTLQVYLGLSQDEANALADERNEITQKMSAYALLLAIPSIIFSIYGTNFKDMWLEKQNWGYPTIVALTVVLCGFAYWRLRRSGWL